MFWCCISSGNQKNVGEENIAGRIKFSKSPEINIDNNNYNNSNNFSNNNNFFNDINNGNRKKSINDSNDSDNDDIKINKIQNQNQNYTQNQNTNLNQNFNQNINSNQNSRPASIQKRKIRSPDRPKTPKEILTENAVAESMAVYLAETG